MANVRTAPRGAWVEPVAGSANDLAATEAAEDLSVGCQQLLTATGRSEARMTDVMRDWRHGARPRPRIVRRF